MHSHRPLAGDARPQPHPQPGVRAHRGRHADAEARSNVRCRLRTRRDRLHDDGGRPLRRDRDRSRAREARRRGRPHTGHDAGALSPGHDPTAATTVRTAAACATSSGAHDPDPVATTYEIDFVVVLREEGKPTRVEYERHSVRDLPGVDVAPSDREGRPRAHRARRRGSLRGRARGLRRASAGLTPSEEGSTLV